MRDRHGSQGFVQKAAQDFLAQSSELGDVAAGTLLVGVRGQPETARAGLMFLFRGTAQYGAYERYFCVAGQQVVQLDIGAYVDWSLRLVAAASTTLPPSDPPLAWAATTPHRPDPARRDKARLAVSYTNGEIYAVPPGAVRCWSASPGAVTVNWTTCTAAASMMVLSESVSPGVEVTPKGTNLQPTSNLDLIWEIEL